MGKEVGRRSLEILSFLRESHRPPRGGSTRVETNVSFHRRESPSRVSKVCNRGLKHINDRKTKINKVQINEVHDRTDLREPPVLDTVRPLSLTVDFFETIGPIM